MGFRTPRAANPDTETQEGLCCDVLLYLQGLCGRGERAVMGRKRERARRRYRAARVCRCVCSACNRRDNAGTGGFGAGAGTCGCGCGTSFEFEGYGTNDISRKPAQTVTELASARNLADHHGARGGFWEFAVFFLFFLFCFDFCLFIGHL